MDVCVIYKARLEMPAAGWSILESQIFMSRVFAILLIAPDTTYASQVVCLNHYLLVL